MVPCGDRAYKASNQLDPIRCKKNCECVSTMLHVQTWVVSETSTSPKVSRFCILDCLGQVGVLCLWSFCFALRSTQPFQSGLGRTKVLLLLFLLDLLLIVGTEDSFLAVLILRRKGVMLRLYVFLLANVLLTDVFQVLPSPWLLVSAKDRLSWKDFKLEDSTPYGSFFKSTSPSIRQWENIDVDKHFSILSMQVDHHQESNWFMPSLHEKHSIGWNRTLDTGFGRRPYACTLRFFGVALESTLQDYVRGGSGFITLGFKREDNKQIWNGFDKNETKRIYCYYNTNKDTGSEFLVCFTYPYTSRFIQNLIRNS